jgi:hypothetical protein
MFKLNATECGTVIPVYSGYLLKNTQIEAQSPVDVYPD